MIICSKDNIAKLIKKRESKKLLKQKKALRLNGQILFQPIDFYYYFLIGYE